VRDKGGQVKLITNGRLVPSLSRAARHEMNNRGESEWQGGRQPQLRWEVMLISACCDMVIVKRRESHRRGI
jgi:hypothetical protein